MGILLHYRYRCNSPGSKILHRPSTCCGVTMRASCAIGTRLAVAGDNEKRQTPSMSKPSEARWSCEMELVRYWSICARNTVNF